MSTNSSMLKIAKGLSTIAMISTLQSEGVEAIKVHSQAEGIEHHVRDMMYQGQTLEE